MTAVERHVADNETERNHKRVLEIIRGAGDDGLGKSELIRRTQFVDKRQRDEILVTLVEAGLVTMAMRSTPTKPALSYRAAGRGRDWENLQRAKRYLNRREQLPSA